MVYGTVIRARDRSVETRWTSDGSVERRIVDPISFRESLYIIYQPLVRSAAVQLSVGRAGAIAPKRTRTLKLTPPVRYCIFNAGGLMRATASAPGPADRGSAAAAMCEDDSGEGDSDSDASGPGRLSDVVDDVSSELVSDAEEMCDACTPYVRPPVLPLLLTRRDAQSKIRINPKSNLIWIIHNPGSPFAGLCCPRE